MNRLAIRRRCSDCIQSLPQRKISKTIIERFYKLSDSSFFSLINFLVVVAVVIIAMLLNNFYLVGTYNSLSHFNQVKKKIKRKRSGGTFTNLLGNSDERRRECGGGRKISVTNETSFVHQ